MLFPLVLYVFFVFFFSSRRRHTRFDCDWSSDVCSSDLQMFIPSLWRKYEPSTSRFGNFSFTLLSATFRMLMPCLMWTTPMCFGLLPDTGRCFLMPPLPTRALTTTIPCFALYPSL